MNKDFHKMNSDCGYFYSEGEYQSGLASHEFASQNLASHNQTSSGLGSEELEDEEDPSDHDKNQSEEDEFNPNDELQKMSTYSKSTLKYTFKSRTPKLDDHSSISSLRKGWIVCSEWSESRLRKMDCCRRLKCSKNSNISFLRAKLRSSAIVSFSNRRKSLMQMIDSTKSFRFDGQKVCTTFLVKAFGFSRKLIKNVRDVQCGYNESAASSSVTDSSQYMCSVENVSSDRSSHSRDSKISFLERLAENTGDQMPDTGEYPLPFFRNHDVFNIMLSENKILHPDCNSPTQSYFLTAWKMYCKKRKVRKLQPFAKCEICDELREAIKKTVAQHKDTKDLLERKSAHDAFISRERLEYRKKMDRSVLDPTEFMSVIMDGADQSSFGLPHFITSTKAQKGYSIKVKLVGLLQHGRPNRLFLYKLSEEHATGANHIVESLHLFIIEKTKLRLLPPKLFIQLDNCSRENKNKYLMAYLESLVGWSVFKEVEVGFLPVCHTHEDIDQTFSTTSSRLRNNDAITLKELHNELRQCYNQYTAVEDLEKLIKWSGLCDSQHILTHVRGVTLHRYFRFSRSETSTSAPTNCLNTWKKSICMVRKNCVAEWSYIFKSNPNKTFLSSTPNLFKTPDLKIKSSTNGDEIRKRIQSEETRIQYKEKMKSICNLRDRVLSDRTDIFHWNIEPGHFHPYHASSHSQLPPIGELEDQSSPGENISHELEYFANKFISVQTDDVGKFGIRKITKVIKNNEGKCVQLVLHWYDIGSSSHKYTGKYKPCFAPTKQKVKIIKWDDQIPVESVICYFDKLKNRGSIPTEVVKKIRQHPSTISGH